MAVVEIAARDAPALVRLQAKAALAAPADLGAWIVAAGFLVAALWVAWSGLDMRVAAALGVVGLVSVGLPHGQFDWRTARASLAPRLGRPWAAAFLGVYLGLAGLMAALWLWSPMVGFLSFLALSVLHFGIEDHQAGLAAPHLPAVVGLGVRGALPFIVPALVHPERMAWWVAEVTGADAGKVMIPLHMALSVLAPVWFIGAVALVGLYLRKGRAAAAAEFAAAALALAVLPLVPGFLLWFVIGHSPRHLVQVFKDAPPHHRGRWLLRQLGWGAVVSALLLAGLAGAAQLASPLWALRLAVAGLAAVTLPHLLTCAFLQAPFGDGPACGARLGRGLEAYRRSTRPLDGTLTERYL